MRIRRIAIFIDGAFFLKRLPRLVEERFRDTPEAVAETARMLCKKHVVRLVGEEVRDGGRWLDHAYRFFYYDARPYRGVAHHPLANRQIRFADSSEAEFRKRLFAELRKKRKFALRLGRVEKAGGWQIKDEKLIKRLLRMENLPELFRRLADGETINPAELSPEQQAELRRLAESWDGLSERDVNLSLRQKGVDMRLGIDITSITLKKQADTLILVTGDSDFVPAAKLARREGAEVILDPMWQSVKPELHEHIDGLCSVLGQEGEGDEREE